MLYREVTKDLIPILMTDYATKSLLLLALLLTTTAATWCKKEEQSTYHENLATHRMQFAPAQREEESKPQAHTKKSDSPVTAVCAITEQLDHLLACRKKANEQIKYLQGYTIQAYVGGSRDEAFKIRNKLHSYYPAILPAIQYDASNYTVSVGRFLHKLEAYLAYAVISKYVSQAIIRPISFANRPNIFTNQQAVEEVGEVALPVPSNVPEEREQEPE